MCQKNVTSHGKAQLLIREKFRTYLSEERAKTM